MWLLGALLALVLALSLGLQVPAVQQFAARKVTAFLAYRLKTNITVGRFTTDWRNSLVLKNIYLEDKNGDTLLYAGRLGLDLNIMALRQQKLNIRSASISDALLQIHATLPDSAYNFDFIIEALRNPDPARKDTAGIFYFKLSNLRIENTRLNLNDAVKGTSAKANVGLLVMKTQNLDSENPLLDLGNLKLENTSVFLEKTKAPDTANTGVKLNYTFEKIRVKNVDLTYENIPALEQFNARIGNAEVKTEKIDLAQNRLDLSAFLLENASLKLSRLKVPSDSNAVKYPAAKIKKPVSPNNKPGKSWAIWLNDGRLKNVDLQYGNFNFPAKSHGLDLNRIRLSKIDLQLSKVYYDKNGVSGLLEQLQFREKCGFRVRAGSGTVNAGKRVVRLQKVDLQTPGGFLKADLVFNFPEEKKLPGRKTKTTFTATIRSSKIAPQEVLFLAPELGRKPLFRKSAQRPFTFSGNVWGQSDDLHFRNFRLRLLTATVVDLDGNIRNISEAGKRETVLKIRKLATNRPDLKVLQASPAGKKAINFPATLTASGSLQNRGDRLSFQNLNMQAANGLRVQVTGQVTGNKKPYTYLDVKQLSANRAAILDMLPPGTITPEVQLPDHIRFSGVYRGYSLKEFALKGSFITTFGNVKTDVEIAPVQRFFGHIELEDFNLGKILKQEKTMGPVTGKADFEGKGFKVQTMELHYNANVKKFVYQKETFRNIRLEGNLNQKIYQLNGNLANAALQGLGHKLKKIKPKNLDLKKADPTRLLPKNVEPKKLVPKFLRKKKKPAEEEAK